MPSKRSNAKPKTAKRKTRPKKAKLLSGGNPQIAKGEGNAPVQAYIAAIPGWKRDVAKNLDALVVRTVPKVKKAVKWNSPFYGLEGKGWFLNFHCFAKYVKVAFFKGTSLRPPPPACPPAPEDPHAPPNRAGRPPAGHHPTQHRGMPAQRRGHDSRQPQQHG